MRGPLQGQLTHLWWTRSRQTQHSKPGFPRQKRSLGSCQDGKEARSWRQSHSLELARQNQVQTRTNSEGMCRVGGTLCLVQETCFSFCLC